PGPSLAFIEAAFEGRRDAAILDVGGGSSPLAAELMARGYRDLAVLDISATAIGLAQERMGEAATHVEWIVAGLLHWRPPRHYALWHDRATLHFLILDADRERYAEIARSAVAPGGHAVIATFAPDGPTNCSGLPVHRSSPEDIVELLGDQFTLVRAAEQLH